MAFEASQGGRVALRFLTPIRRLVARYRHALLVLWPFAVMAVAVGSLVPQLAPPPGQILFVPLDKLIHFSAYGGLAFLPQVSVKRLNWAVLGALSMSLLGIAVEIAQNYMPGREGSIVDAVANTIGVGLGLAFGLLLRPAPAERTG